MSGGTNLHNERRLEFIRVLEVLLLLTLILPLTASMAEESGAGVDVQKQGDSVVSDIGD